MSDAADELLALAVKKNMESDQFVQNVADTALFNAISMRVCRLVPDGEPLTVAEAREVMNLTYHQLMGIPLPPPAEDDEDADEVG